MPQMVVWPFMAADNGRSRVFRQDRPFGRIKPPSPLYQGPGYASIEGPLQKVFEILPPHAKLAKGVA